MKKKKIKRLFEEQKRLNGWLREDFLKLRNDLGNAQEEIEALKVKLYLLKDELKIIVKKTDLTCLP